MCGYVIVLEMAERETSSANGGLDHTKLVRFWEKDCIDWLISKQDTISRKHTTDAGIPDYSMYRLQVTEKPFTSKWKKEM